MTNAELTKLVNTLANSVTPVAALDGQDVTGTRVSSLTEAVMGITAAACKIADALDNVADAIRESSRSQH